MLQPGRGIFENFRQCLCARKCFYVYRTRRRTGILSTFHIAVEPCNIFIMYRRGGEGEGRARGGRVEGKGRVRGGEDDGKARGFRSIIIFFSF